jgi:hypothetical protein
LASGWTRSSSGATVAALFFEMWDGPSLWGNQQPKFERLERDGAGYCLVYRLPSGAETRVRLGPAPRYEPES